MKMKTFSLAAAALFVGTTTASAVCQYGHDAKMASTPIKKETFSERVYVAEMPTDAWLIKFLDEWKQV